MIDAPLSSAPRMVWTVSALLQAVADSLAARFNPCTLRGEISGYARAASSHVYFNLKDSEGGAELLRCAMFRRAASLLDFTPADGHRVELRGRLDVYGARGELQMIVESMQRDGAGALYEQFLRLKARLEAQGLFDPARRRSLTRHPRAVGVVTSLGAAALRDVITTITRRAPHVRVVVYPSLVQGADAPADLAAAIERAGARGEVDSLILCRGGGSVEDLWAFNDERVVRALAASPIPVVCGVGHESDVTLCDFAADVRAATPTAAAELSVPERAELQAQLAVFAARMHRAAGHRLELGAQRLDRAAARLGRPVERLAGEALRVRMLALRLPGALVAALQRRRERVRIVAGRMAHAGELDRARRHHCLDNLVTRLRACDPRTVVSRGYALAQLADGELVVDPAQLHAGCEVDLTLARGRASVELARIGVK